MPGIGIISNPYARVNRKNPEHNTLMWYVLGNKGQFQITNNLSDLSSVCNEFRERSIDVVGILGGDGTISLTLSALVQSYKGKELPKILLLRGGTVNVLSQNLGIFGKPKHILDDFLSAYHGSKSLHETRIHSLDVNGRLGFLFANGTASQFLKEFYKNKGSSFSAGLFLGNTALDVALKGKWNSNSKNILVEEEFARETNFRLREEAIRSSLILASTIPKMPFGIPVFQKIDVRRASGEAQFYKSKDSALAWNAIQVLTGMKVSNDGREILEFESMLLEYSRAVDYSLDGDLLHAPDGKINISVSYAFTFVSPYGKVL
jgi:hypothetical protein